MNQIMDPLSHLQNMFGFGYKVTANQLNQLNQFETATNGGLPTLSTSSTSNPVSPTLTSTPPVNAIDEDDDITGETYRCHLCSYTGTSKSQFNSHMNSHFDHKCPFCDYTSRTEGRLKRHIRDFHSEVPPDSWAGTRVPRRDSNGETSGGGLDGETSNDGSNPSTGNNNPPKLRKYKCKQCSFVALSKTDFWEHNKTHIKAEKLLTCPKCSFLTEYKHHLEYHLRNHFGSKPFKCAKCNYSCVNKSMLNSHMKSHSNIYQYRCNDCSYATKYCHSLKLHLRKYNHKPATVLNLDGTPNPYPIIDVYGTRRGPRPKKNRSSKNKTETNGAKSQLPENSIQQDQDQDSHQLIPKTNLLPSPTGPVNILSRPFPPLIPSSLSSIGFPFMNQFYSFCGSNNLLGSTLPLMSPPMLSGPPMSQLQPQTSPLLLERPESNCMDIIPAIDSTPTRDMENGEASPLDLSSNCSNTAVSSTKDSQTKDITEVPIDNNQDSTSSSRRRKGKAIKLDHMRLKRREAEMTSADEASEDDAIEPQTGGFTCSHCDMCFKDCIMYTMHMGYHGFEDPFTCNMCGEQSKDKVAFFLHIARQAHL